ncbi:SAP domain-containing protein [Staphylococcus ureilyticus]|uniref:SAP domain-containing protein n=1 Tax=Staphylococcus ureilyticus TaxID=94138 RepID=UPI0009280AB1|nr:SAP domain-containing protein [Staphylococcus ureilyticus]OJT35413.1 hypothetical protein BSF33_04995 [Staphylococcus ureilyticus]
MEINCLDLVVLHKNANKQEGDEQYKYIGISITKNKVLKTIEKLIDNDILIRDNRIDVKLSKLNNKKLMKILENNHLTKGGTKKELIKRIVDNLECINEDYLDLPSVYSLSEKGEKIIKETEYISYFTDTSVLVPIDIFRAYEIVENHLSDNIEDKIQSVFEYEIEKIPKPGSNSKYDFDEALLYSGLANYYWKHKADIENARKYINLELNINLINNLNQVRPSYYFDYDIFTEEGQTKLESGILHSDSYTSSVYKHLLYIDELSNDVIKELFIKDLGNHGVLDKDIYFNFIDVFISFIKGENCDDEMSNLISRLKKLYSSEKEEIQKLQTETDDFYSIDEEKEDNYFFKTNINKLFKSDVEIEVEIDKDTGDLYFSLDKDAVKKIIDE